MIVRVRYRIEPGAPHVRCFVYAAPGPDRTFALLGAFSVRAEELEGVIESFPKAEFVSDLEP